MEREIIVKEQVRGCKGHGWETWRRAGRLDQAKEGGEGRRDCRERRGKGTGGRDLVLQVKSGRVGSLNRSKGTYGQRTERTAWRGTPLQVSGALRHCSVHCGENNRDCEVRALRSAERGSAAETPHLSSHRGREEGVGGRGGEQQGEAASHTEVEGREEGAEELEEREDAAAEAGEEGAQGCNLQQMLEVRD